MDISSIEEFLSCFKCLSASRKREDAIRNPNTLADALIEATAIFADLRDEDLSAEELATCMSSRISEECFPDIDKRNLAFLEDSPAWDLGQSAGVGHTHWAMSQFSKHLGHLLLIIAVEHERQSDFIDLILHMTERTQRQIQVVLETWKSEGLTKA
eukprot:GHVO01023470.1.p2 GENE.GHVO01023470.1~~GHVO01023470.1.p2  ORF type:complete len:156 (-),score=37.53 GHVO01023470.1:789-1256(-)